MIWPPSKHQKKHGRGFTLVELLIVIAIMVLLTTVSVTSFSAIHAGKFSAGLSQLTETIANARLAAMSNNTYAWVGINAPSASNGSAEIDMASVISTTGQSADLTTPGRIRPLSNPVVIPFLMLQDYLDIGMTPSLSPSSKDTACLVADISTTSSYSQASGTNSLQPFQQTVHGSPVSFTQIIQFNPRGEASVLTTGPTRFIQIGLQSANGTTASAHNVAVVRISGLSGQISVSRPGDGVSGQ